MSWRALAAAGHAGDEPLARAALSDSDPVARELGLGALQRMGRLDDDDLVAAAADPGVAERRRGAMYSATRPDIALDALLADLDDSVVEAAAWAAGEQQPLLPQPDDTVMDRLVYLATNHTDALVREAAVASLGAIGDQRGLAAILAGCADKPAIRRRAVLALAPFEGPEVDAALAIALEDRDWQVRQSAEDVAPFMQPDQHLP